MGAIPTVTEGQKPRVMHDRSRVEILNAAFEEMYKFAYQAASLCNILKKTNLTKGALYHHFNNKKELGLAVVRERIGGHLDRLWITPIKNSENPIIGVKKVLRFYMENMEISDIRLGCPLNNLTQEMSPLDEDFRVELTTLLEGWFAAIKNALHKAQKQGLISHAINCDDTTHFFLSTFFGIMTLGKNHASLHMYQNTLRLLENYVDNLQTVPERGENGQFSTR